MLVCVCSQITWLEGHSLAQTVFTCLYVHNPDLIEEPALKAFALGILKVCDIAREKVNKAAVFEEVSNVCICGTALLNSGEGGVRWRALFYVQMCVAIFRSLSRLSHSTH